LSDCPLSLNGIAKGSIVERACDLALDPGRGVRGLMLNVGGGLGILNLIDGLIAITSPDVFAGSSGEAPTLPVTDNLTAWGWTALGDASFIASTSDVVVSRTTRVGKKRASREPWGVVQPLWFRSTITRAG
jgi:hypothetical protein